MRWLKQILCHHNVVRVVRWHRDVVKPEMKDKLLYVDNFNVHNFVQCQKCMKILHTNQMDQLRGQKE